MVLEKTKMGVGGDMMLAMCSVRCARAPQDSSRSKTASAAEFLAAAAVICICLIIRVVFEAFRRVDTVDTGPHVVADADCGCFWRAAAAAAAAAAASSMHTVTMLRVLHESGSSKSLSKFSKLDDSLHFTVSPQ